VLLFTGLCECSCLLVLVSAIVYCFWLVLLFTDLVSALVLFTGSVSALVYWFLVSALVYWFV